MAREASSTGFSEHLEDHLGVDPERGRLLDLLVERVDYDGAAGKISIRFRPTGIRSLAQQGDLQ